MVIKWKIWVRVSPGGLHGLQIHSRVVTPSGVGSIPTRSRQFNEKYSGHSLKWIHSLKDMSIL